MTNFYQILGLANYSDIETIKKTYRKLAIEMHPDRNIGDEDILLKFKNITNAYNELKIAKEKQEYDQKLRLFLANKPQNLINKNEMTQGALIDFFYCSRTKIFQNETIEFAWKTLGAEVVYLHPLGQVMPKGIKKIKFKKIPPNGIRVDLVAYNTAFSQKDQQTFWIKDVLKLPSIERNSVIKKRIGKHLKKHMLSYINILIFMAFVSFGIYMQRFQTKKVEIVAGERTYYILTQERFNIEKILQDSIRNLDKDKKVLSDSYYHRVEKIIEKVSKKYPTKINQN